MRLTQAKDSSIITTVEAISNKAILSGKFFYFRPLAQFYISLAPKGACLLSLKVVGLPSLYCLWPRQPKQGDRQAPFGVLSEETRGVA